MSDTSAAEEDLKFEEGKLYPGEPKAREHNQQVVRDRGNTVVLYSYETDNGTEYGTVGSVDALPSASDAYDGPELTVISENATAADRDKLSAATKAKAVQPVRQ